MYGPTGIIIGVAAGLLRVLYIKKENNAEIVPVDLCVNSLIASGYDIGTNSYEEPPVYNYVSSQKNPITWKTYTDLATEYGEQAPLSKTAWYYSFTMSNSKLLVTILTFLYHFLPAAIVDIGLFVCGKKPKWVFNQSLKIDDNFWSSLINLYRLLDTYRKIHKLCDVLSYFTNRVWKFNNNNVKVTKHFSDAIQ